MSDPDVLRERLMADIPMLALESAAHAYRTGVDAALAALEQVTTDAAWMGGPMYRITSAPRPTIGQTSERLTSTVTRKKSVNTNLPRITPDTEGEGR